MIQFFEKIPQLMNFIKIFLVFPSKKDREQVILCQFVFHH